MVPTKAWLAADQLWPRWHEPTVGCILKAKDVMEDRSKLNVKMAHRDSTGPETYVSTTSGSPIHHMLCRPMLITPIKMANSRS